MVKDYGVIPNYFIGLYTAISKYVYNKRLMRKIKRAEELSALTGYRFIVIRFYGQMRLLRKHDVKEWIRRGKFKKGVTIADIEKKALYITKIKAKCI